MSKDRPKFEDFDSPWKDALQVYQVHEIEKEKNVRYVTSIERYGFKKGIERGIEKGLRAGIVESIALDLDIKFGPAGAKLLRKVQSLEDIKHLRAFAKFLKTARSLDEVREHLQSL